MMKKIKTTKRKAVVGLLALVLFASNINTVAGKGGYDLEKPKLQVLGIPTLEKIRIDEKEIELKAYNIEGYNYLMLRDLACILKGTQKQFEVEWDQEKSSIKLIRGRAYTGRDIVLDMGENTSKEKAYKSTSKIYIDGQESKIKGYRINDNTYFKLRDLAKEIDFALDWDYIDGIELVLSDRYINKDQVQLNSVKDVGLLGYSDINIPSKYKKNLQSNVKNKNQEMKESMLELINEAREKEGLKPLVLDKQLIEMSRFKATDMKEANLLSHSGSYGELKDLLNKFNIDYRTAGENILKGCSCEKEMFHLWWSSPGHRANMMNPDYNKIGIAFAEIESAESTNKFWAVQEFTD